MELIPAIDLINGKAVRLKKGDFQTARVFHTDPLQFALELEQKGFSRLHMVDLDGAKSGKPVHLELLETIKAKTNLVIDFGGGIRTLTDVRSVISSGADILCLGTSLVSDREFSDSVFAELNLDRILAALDVKNGKVQLKGWTVDSSFSFADMAKLLPLNKCYGVMCTDVSKDGMMEGPSLALYKQILGDFPKINLIASGGVRNQEDLVSLHNLGCKGAILGKSLFGNPLSEKPDFKNFRLWD